MMKSVKADKARFAIVRPVPASYNHCLRTNTEEINVSLAKRQHKEYCNTLQKQGLELLWVEMDNSLPDSCFVEDTAVILGEKAIICNMKAKSRAGEIIEVAKMLEKMKETYRIRPPATIDGGDVLRIEGKVLIGLSARTNFHAANQLGKLLENSCFEVVPVKIRNVLHLKSACTYLGENCVILSKSHFDTGILRGYNKIIVPHGEEYAADCLAVNGTVLLAKGYPKTKILIEKEGFPVEELNISEFRKGEGALTCLSIIY